MNPVEQGRIDMERPDFNAGRKRDAEKRMAFFDKASPVVRTLINDYGVAPVMAIYQAGVRDPRHFRHIIDTIRGETLDGERTVNPNGRIKNTLRDDDDGVVYVATNAEMPGYGERTASSKGTKNSTILTASERAQRATAFEMAFKMARKNP